MDVVMVGNLLMEIGTTMKTEKHLIMGLKL